MKKTLLLILIACNLTSCDLIKATEVSDDDTNNTAEETIYTEETTDNEAELRVFTYFNEDIAQLKEIAQTTDKKIILFFGADWCGPCKKYKNQTFLEKNNYMYLNQHYIVKYLDVETDFEGIEYQQKYNIQVLPVLMFFSEKFDKIAEIKGHLDGYSFYKKIKAINEEN